MFNGETSLTLQSPRPAYTHVHQTSLRCFKDLFSISLKPSFSSNYLHVGCTGIFQALPFTSGRHFIETEGPKPPKHDPTAVLWTVFLCYSVSDYCIFEDKIK